MIRRPRTVAAVTAAVTVVVVAAAIVALQPKPVVTLESGWGMGPNYYTSGIGYILIGGELSNAGGADGYAVVNWVINNNVVQQVRYLVPAHGSFSIALYQPWYGVAVLGSELVLLSVQRA